MAEGMALGFVIASTFSIRVLLPRFYVDGSSVWCLGGAKGDLGRLWGHLQTAVEVYLLRAVSAQH